VEEEIGEQQEQVGADDINKKRRRWRVVHGNENEKEAGGDGKDT
jgi:hypothetical protein